MNLRGWNRHWTAATLALVMVVGAVAGCDNLGGKKKEEAGSGSGATQPPATGPIKIGHYASLTGNEATFGNSTDQGIKLAVEERNAAGGIKGRKIELITLDTASKASEGGTVVTRLITQDKVVALLGEVASSITLAGGDVAQKLGVPNITPSSTNVHVTELGDMVSRVCFTDDFQAWVIAKFLYDNQKITKVAVLYDEAQAYSKGLVEYFTAAYKKLGGTIVTEQAYTGGNPDASAQLQTIKGSGAEALFLPGYYGDAGNFMKQAKQKGLTIPFIGTDGWDSPDLLKIAGDAANGHYFSTHYSPQEPRPEVQAFVKAFKAKFGVEPDSLSAMGYDAARVLFDAMDRASSFDGKTLAAAINATKDFKGVTGSISIDANRNAQKKAVILQVVGTEYKLVSDIWPEGMGPPTTKPMDDGGAGSGSAAAGSAASTGPIPAEGAKANAATPATGAAATKIEAAVRGDVDLKGTKAPPKAMKPDDDKSDPEDGSE